MHGVCSQAYSPVCAATAHAAPETETELRRSQGTAADKSDTQRGERGTEKYRRLYQTQRCTICMTGGGGKKTRYLKDQFTQIPQNISYVPLLELQLMVIISNMNISCFSVL